MRKMMMMWWEPVCHKTKRHTVYWGIVPHHFSIYSSSRISDGQPCGGGIWMVNTIHLASPAGSHASQPDLTVGYRVYYYNYFVTGEDNKAIFFYSQQYIYVHKVCKRFGFAIILDSSKWKLKLSSVTTSRPLPKKKRTGKCLVWVTSKLQRPIKKIRG
jgi:hypothetical protein